MAAEETTLSATGEADAPPGAADELPIVDPSCYELGEELGRGGEGRVIVARDRRTGRTVMIKQPRFVGGGRESRFLREVRITARLEHPGIVPVYESARWPTGEPFYAMRLVPGRPLKQALAEATSLDHRLALLPHLVAVADAMAYAHAQRVIHRDLKPGNVMVGPFGEAVVIDWGLAHDLGLGDGEGGVVGTPPYLAPEQARGEAVDPRADVYAVGAMLYQLLVGEPPHGRGAPAELIERVLAGPPASIERLEPRAPRELVAIAEKAMARDPERRYPSAGELAAELRRFMTGQLVAAHRYTRRELAVRFAKRNRHALAVAALALLALAIVGGASVRRIAVERSAAVHKGRALMLNQAESWIGRDPTATLAWLKAYVDAGGDDWARVEELARVARSFGVAWMVVRDARAAALSSDGATLAVDDGTELWVRDLPSGREERRPSPGAAQLRISPDGDLVAIVSDGRLRLWDPRAGAPRDVEAGVVEQVAFDRDGRLLAIGTAGGALVTMDLATGVLTPRARGGAFTGLTFTPDGELAWIDDGAVRLLAPGDERPAEVSIDDAVAVAVDVEGRVIVAGEDGRLRLFDADGLFIRVLVGKGVDRVAVSPDGEMIARADEGGVVVVGERDTQAPRPLKGHEASLRVLDVAANRTILSLDRGGQLRLWRVPPHGQRAGKRGDPPGDDAQRLAFSPDGRLIAFASEDGAAVARDLFTAERHVLAHAHVVRSLAFSPDGRFLATGTHSSFLRLWDTRTWRLVAVLRGAKPIVRITFARDLTSIAVTEVDGARRRWDLPEAQIAETPSRRWLDEMTTVTTGSL